MLVVSHKTLLHMQHHALCTKFWTAFAGISDKLVGCCKEELSTDGVVVALSFSVCLSVRSAHTGATIFDCSVCITCKCAFVSLRLSVAMM
jgi:hypothetical protein